MNNIDIKGFANDFIKSLAKYQDSKVVIYKDCLYIIDSLYICRMSIFEKDIYKKPKILDEEIKDIDFSKINDLINILADIDGICEKRSGTVVFTEKKNIIDTLNLQYKTIGKLSKLNIDILVTYSSLYLKCIPRKQKTSLKSCDINMDNYRILRLGDDNSAQVNSLIFLRILELLNGIQKVKLEIMNENTLKIRIKSPGNLDICWVLGSDNILETLLSNKEITKKCY